jgi:hypothetical protein
VRCHQATDHVASTTLLGDGTVVIPSSSFGSDTVAAIDLKQVSDTLGKKYEHSNILTASTTQAAIESIVTSSGGAGQKQITMDKLRAIPGVKIGEPISPGDLARVVVRTHSPVELHIYDPKGNHTGLIPKPAELATNDFVEAAYEEKIPGSRFDTVENNDGDFETTISLPEETGQKYSVSVEGTDFGMVGFDVELLVGDSSKGKVAYTMEPVTPLMVATTSVGGNVTNGYYIPVASTTPALHVDIDGDGTLDFEAIPGSGLPGNAKTTDQASAEASKAMSVAMNKVIGKLSTDERRKAVLLRLIQKFMARIKSGQVNNAAIAQTLEHIGHKKLKSLSSADREKILNLIERLTSAGQ